MTIPFVGGPYDGMKLTATEVKQHLRLLSLRSQRNVRRLVYLPAVEDWPEVLAGRIFPDQSHLLYYYELVSAPGGAQFWSDDAGGGYKRAIDEVVRDGGRRRHGSQAVLDGRPNGADDRSR